MSNMPIKQMTRLVKRADFADVLDIYKPFITSGNITPENEIPALENFSAKIEAIANHYPFLVS